MRTWGACGHVMLWIVLSACGGEDGLGNVILVETTGLEGFPEAELTAAGSEIVTREIDTDGDGTNDAAETELFVLLSTDPDFCEPIGDDPRARGTAEVWIWAYLEHEVGEDLLLGDEIAFPPNQWSVTAEYESGTIYRESDLSDSLVVGVEASIPDRYYLQDMELEYPFETQRTEPDGGGLPEITPIDADIYIHLSRIPECEYLLEEEP
jgi:hypothetical protein